MKIGRNDPCFCGSGKKYKNCCLKKKDLIPVPSVPKGMELENISPEDYMSLMEIGFFEKHPYKMNSPIRLVYTSLINPDYEKLSSEMDKGKYTSWIKESTRIQNESDSESLIKMMEKGIDTINYPLFIEKALEFSDVIIPKIIDKLKDTEITSFAELSVKIIRRADTNYSKELIDILDSIKSPYSASLTCLLLGMIGPEKIIPTLFDYYDYFNSKYLGEGFEQGPLIALHEFKYKLGII